MSTAYTVLGTDGQQTGPLDLATLQSWIDEGRVNRDQLVFRSDLTEWFKAGEYSEMNWLGGAAAAAVSAPRRDSAPIGGSTDDHHDVAQGASWPYWIGGLSAVNFIMAVSGSGTSFSLGTAVATILGLFARNEEGVPMLAVIGWVGGLLFCALWGLLGYCCHKAHRWAFLVAVLLTAGDTLLTFMGGAWLSVAIHCWALWRLFGGLLGAFKLRSGG